MSPVEPNDDREIEGWLVRSRARPEDGFVDRLEGRLVPTRRVARTRVAIAGLGLSGALASALVVAALVGGGPLQSGDDGARAGDDCVIERVRTTDTQGRLVRGADGRARVVTTEKPVVREVKRCR